MESGLERESLGVILHHWTFPENLDIWFQMRMSS